MGVDRLPWKEKQPFYNVMVEDGSCRYAASENLMPTKPQRIIGNPQVVLIRSTVGMGMVFLLIFIISP